MGFVRNIEKADNHKRLPASKRFGELFRNNVHSLLQYFLNSHSGFIRKYTDDYLNLFVFIMNPPHNKLQKAELFLDIAIRTRVSLKYREFYKSEPADEDEN